MKVENGHKVKVEYTGKLDDGTVFDSSKGKDPLEFVAGSGQVIKGFDEAVMGMNVGEEKSVSLEPKNAYGPKMDQLVQDVPKTAFGKETPKEGTTVGIKAPTGQVLPAKVMAIKGDKVTLDMNHPLAGKKLNFELKLIESKKLSAEEKKAMEAHQHEHVHDENCNH